MYQAFLDTALYLEIKQRIERDIPEPKRTYFQLLYSAKRDGCSVKAFHDKCTDKGPTLTVLYGKTGTIYGGYTSGSWSSDKHKRVLCDPSAFLFYCRENMRMETLEMKPEHRTWAISCGKNWGPSFGGGFFKAFDLQVFNGDKPMQKVGEHFRLNGSINFNCTYTCEGKDTISQENLNVDDVEIYQVFTNDSESTMLIIEANTFSLSIITIFHALVQALDSLKNIKRRVCKIWSRL